MKKKFLALFLAVVMLLTLLPVTALAVEDPIESWGALQDAIDNAEEGDTIQLTQDLSAPSGSDPITISAKLTLDLNGYMLDANYEESYLGSVITLKEGADLTIKDSPNPSAETHDIYSCNGEEYNYGHWFTYKPEGYDDEDDVYKKYVVITGGLITGTYSLAGVYVGEGATCTLESGTIAGNVADDDGGGVFVGEGATFIMNGGTISYNEASYGGGVAVGSRWTSVDTAEFFLNGGSVSNNVAYSDGGGVYVSAYPQDFAGPYFTMTGGSIKNNTAPRGGGVALEDCDAYSWSSTISATIMKMTGGSITNNYCGTFGGGVFFCAEYEYGSVMLGGTAVISGNWCGDQLDPQPSDPVDNFRIGITPTLYFHGGGVNAHKHVGFFQFDAENAPTDGMDVGVTLLDGVELDDGTRALTATLNYVPEGITSYLYADDLDYMVSTDSKKVVLKENIYPVFYLNDGTTARWKNYALGANNVPMTVPTRTGYIFTGWYAEKTGDTQVYDVTTGFQGSYTAFTAKTAYYAGWELAPEEPTTYQISASATDYVRVDTESAASFTISPKEVGASGYDHVRVKVDVTEKPEDSTSLLISADGGTTNLLTKGYYGAEEGFEIAKNYNVTTPLTMQFDKPGRYTIKFSLVDIDDEEAVLCETTASVTAQDYSTYKFVVNEPEALVKGEAYDSGSVTLKADKNNGIGYDKVCVKVEVTEKPTSAPDPLISADGGVTNLLDTGYLGSSEGFALATNYNVTTPLTVNFDTVGDYKVKFTLVDLNDSNKVLCEATKTIAVRLPNLPCHVAITGTQATGYRLTANVTDLTPGINVTYKWYRCASDTDFGEEIAGATSSTHNLSVYDVGYFLKVRVFAPADSEYGGYVEATTTGAIKHAFSGKPTITVGQANEHPPYLNDPIMASIANTGDVDQSHVTFQWFLCETAGSAGTAIPGATSVSYTPTEADLGKYLKVQITAKPDCSRGGSITSDASEQVKTPPAAAPEVSATASVTEDSVTLIVSGPSNTYEYSADGRNWSDSNVITGLSAAKQYTCYVRVKGTDTAMPSEAKLVATVYTAAAKPAKNEGYSIDYESGKLSVEEGYQVSTSADFGTTLASGSDLEPDTTYYVRKAAVDGGAPASEAASFSIQPSPAAPESAPVLDRKTDSGITLRAVSGQEYSIDDGKTWVSDGDTDDGDNIIGTITFTGLAANTSYAIITRKAAVTTAGSEAFAGEISTASVITTKRTTVSGTAEADPVDIIDGIIRSGDTEVAVKDADGKIVSGKDLNEAATAINAVLDNAAVASYTDIGLEEATKSGNANIIADLQGKTTDQTAKNNVAEHAESISKYLNVELVDVTVDTSANATVTAMTFNVTPMAIITVKDSKNANVTLTTEIDNDDIKGTVTFLLPVGNSIGAKTAAVYHESEFLGNCDIETTANGDKYVIVSTTSFSNFSYITLDRNTAGAVINDGTPDEELYATLADAVSEVKDNETITLLKDASGTITVSRVVKFTVDSGSCDNDATIKAGKGFSISHRGNTYTVTEGNCISRIFKQLFGWIGRKHPSVSGVVMATAVAATVTASAAIVHVAAEIGTTVSDGVKVLVSAIIVGTAQYIQYILSV